MPSKAKKEKAPKSPLPGTPEQLPGETDAQYKKRRTAWNQERLASENKKQRGRPPKEGTKAYWRRKNLDPNYRDSSTRPTQTTTPPTSSSSSGCASLSNDEDGNNDENDAILVANPSQEMQLPNSGLTTPPESSLREETADGAIDDSFGTPAYMAKLDASLAKYDWMYEERRLYSVLAATLPPIATSMAWKKVDELLATGVPPDQISVPQITSDEDIRVQALAETQNMHPHLHAALYGRVY